MPKWQSEIELCLKKAGGQHDERAPAVLASFDAAVVSGRLELAVMRVVEAQLDCRTRCN